jgi:hypothetical protein
VVRADRERRSGREARIREGTTHKEAPTLQALRRPVITEEGLQMRMRTVFGSCAAALLFVTAVAAQQQQPVGDEQRPRTTGATAQQQEITITGCVEDQAGGARASSGAGASAAEFVLVAMDPAGAAGSTSIGGRPTGTTGSTTTGAAAGTRYSLSGSQERQLKAGQRVEITGRMSGAQNRGTTGQGIGAGAGAAGTNRGTTEHPPGGDISRDDPSRAPDLPANEPATGTRSDTGRQTGQTGIGTTGGANMQMLEIVSYRVVTGDCSNNNNIR